MKKSIIIVVSILVTVTAAAQWSAGGRAGINICKTSGKWGEFDDSSIKFIAGPTIMGMGNYQFTDLLSVRGELGYTIMGSKTEYTYEERAMNSMQSSIKEKFNVLQMNLGLQALVVTSLIQYHFLFGLYYNYKLKGTMTDSDGNKIPIGWAQSANRNGDEILLDPDLNRRGDLGIQLGGGIGRELGPGKLELDLRFGYGLLDLAKFPEGTTKPDGYKPYHNLNFSITIGYWYLFDDE